MKRLKTLESRIRTEFICSMYYWQNFGFVYFGKYKIDNQANIKITR